MTRKDTLMIAVLVNAALLIALFVSAIKKEGLSDERVVVEEKPLALPVAVKQEIKTAQGDEIDQVLQDFSKKTVAKEEKSAETKKIDFAKELEAITRASMQPAKKEELKKASSEWTTVTVKKGDALEKMARQHNVTVNAIIDANHLNSTVLQIGQQLKIPTKQSATKTSTAASEAEYYTVKAGDNPWAIAVKNKIKLEELLERNNLNEEKARRLKPGDRLRIR